MNNTTEEQKRIIADLRQFMSKSFPCLFAKERWVTQKHYRKRWNISARTCTNYRNLFFLNGALTGGEGKCARYDITFDVNNDSRILSNTGITSEEKLKSIAEYQRTIIEAMPDVFEAKRWVNQKRYCKHWGISARHCANIRDELSNKKAISGGKGKAARYDILFDPYMKERRYI